MRTGINWNPITRLRRKVKCDIITINFNDKGASSHVVEFINFVLTR